MRNENSANRGPRKPSGSRDGKPSGFKARNPGEKSRSPQAGKRGDGFRAGPRSQGSSRFGEKSESGEGYERKPRGDRAEGSGEARRSSDWSTGGYRITKKGAGKGPSGYKGFKKDDEQGSRGPKRDFERPGGFRGPRSDSERTGGFRGQRSDSERPGGYRGPRSDSERPGGFRSPRSDSERPGGFRGPRSDSERTGGYRGQRSDSERPGGFRGPRSDSERTGGFRGPKRDFERTGSRGPRRDSEGGAFESRGPKREFGRTEGFRGPRRDAEPRSGGFRDSKRGFDKKGPRTPVKKFDNQRPQEDAFKKQEAELLNTTDEEIEREDRVEGRNPVLEAIRSGRPLNKLFVEKDNDDPSLLRIIAMAREKNIPTQYLERYKLDTMSQTRIHQGVILEVAAQEYVEVEDILAKAKEKEEKPFLLVLDGITDTNNLGSIIRSAECSGVHGIILPKRRSATLNATVAKVAAGALEYVPVARVSNLVQTLRELKEEGIWIIGADMDGESNYYDADLTGPCALVIGSEGEGLARLVKDECDLMVRIPMKGKISSLNAGVAAALIMFDIAKQRG